MVEVSTVIDGVKYVLVPDEYDERCDVCALCESNGICNHDSYEQRSFGGFLACLNLNGVWKKVPKLKRRLKKKVTRKT